MRAENTEQVADMVDEVSTDENTNSDLSAGNRSSESDSDILADLEAEVKELHLGSGITDN